MKCVICKQGETTDGVTTVTLQRGESTFIVREVPAQVCPNCGEDYVDAAVTAGLLRSAEDLSRAGTQVEVRHKALLSPADDEFLVKDCFLHPAVKGVNHSHEVFLYCPRVAQNTPRQRTDILGGTASCWQCTTKESFYNVFRPPKRSILADCSPCRAPLFHS